MKKLGEVCDYINGLWTGIKQPFINVGVIRNTNFTKDCKLNDADIQYLDVELKKFENRQLQLGDIIVEKSGGGPKQPVGRVVLFEIEDGLYSFSNFTSVVRIKDQEKLNYHFLHYYLSFLYFNGYTEKLQSNTTGIRNLDFKKYLKTPIPIPPLSVQSAIVAELDSLHHLKELQEQQLEEYDKLAQSTFYAMFGDPIENEKGWEVKKLGKICEITSSKRIFANEYKESGIPFYRSKEIIEKSKSQSISLELFISEDRYIELKENFGVPKIGDILMTAVGTIGEIWVVNDEAPFYFKDGNIVWLKMDNNSNSMYYSYLIKQLVNEYKKKMSIGSAYSALTIINLKNMDVYLPPLSIQTQFSQRIEKIEVQKVLVKQSIAQTEQLINYTMDKYFG